MPETYSPEKASASEATKQIERVGEIMDSLSFESLNQNPHEGVGFTYIGGRIEEWLEGKNRQRYFEVRHYPAKGTTPERRELYTTVHTSHRFTEVFTIDHFSKYTYWKEPKVLMLQRGTAMIYPPQEVKASIDRFADLAQKIKVSAKFI